MPEGEPGFCPHCGAHNPPDYKFCESCEQPLPEVLPHSLPGPAATPPPAAPSPYRPDPVYGKGASQETVVDLSPAVRTWMSFQMGIGGILGGIVALIMAAFINSAVNTPNCTTNTFGQQTCTSVSSFNPSGFIALIGVVFIIFGIVVLYYTRE